jgi:hypothetical protein
MIRKVLLNIVLQPLRFWSILNMFMVHDLNVFQVVFNHKHVWELKKNRPVVIYGKDLFSYVIGKLFNSILE